MTRKKMAPAAAPAPEPETAPTAPKGKTALLIDLLSRPEGATIEAMMAATGWQAHSVRGAIAGAIKKARGHEVVAEKTDTGRVYRIRTGAAA